MAIRNIVKEGDPILNKVCRPVTNFDDRLATLLDDMRETMIAADGVGLAGPQVGMLRRLFVVWDTISNACTGSRNGSACRWRGSPSPGIGPRTSRSTIPESASCCSSQSPTRTTR